MKHTKWFYLVLLASSLFGWIAPLFGQVASLSIIPAHDSSVSQAGGIGGPDAPSIIQSSTWLDLLTFPSVTAAQSGKIAVTGTTTLVLSSIYDLTPGSTVAIQIYGSPLVVTGTASPSYSQIQTAGLTSFGLATGSIGTDGSTLTLKGTGLDAWVTARDAGSSQAASMVLPYFALGDDYFSSHVGPQPELLTAQLVVPEPSAYAIILVGVTALGIALRR